MINLTFQSIDAYLPHKAPMILLDKVLSATENSAVCEVLVNQDGPLTPFLTEKNTLPSWFFIEIMAQTVGVWNGLRLQKNDSEPKIALLLGIRKFHSTIIEAQLNDTITVEAQMMLFDETLSSFTCHLKINNNLIASGNIVAYEATPQQLEKFKQ